MKFPRYDEYKKNLMEWDVDSLKRSIYELIMDKSDTIYGTGYDDLSRANLIMLYQDTILTKNKLNNTKWMKRQKI